MGEPTAAAYLVGIDLGTTHTVVASAPLGAGRTDAPITLFAIDQWVAPGELAARPLLPSVRYHPAPGELAASALPWGERARGDDVEQARGRARVFNNADNLHTLEPGDILVCESTSPNWTPAFAKIAGCVCDGGGMLSHAAIVGREYGVPTVTAVGLGTVVIAEGDEVEVDGDTGTVTVIKKA